MNSEVTKLSSDEVTKWSSGKVARCERRIGASPLRHSATRPLRGFSIVEMLVALAISATLLTAALSAFDASWRGYKHITESASTHVVSRIVVHRMLAMIRTGTQFGPFPSDVLDNTQNPLTSNFMEFVAEADRVAGNGQVTKIERRAVVGRTGEYELWYVLLQGNSGSIIQERPLLSGVKEAAFILEYEPGPRLVRATIDLTVQPNDDMGARIGVGEETPTIRLVASSSPRQLQ